MKRRGMKGNFNVLSQHSSWETERRTQKTSVRVAGLWVEVRSKFQSVFQCVPEPEKTCSPFSPSLLCIISKQFKSNTKNASNIGYIHMYPNVAELFPRLKWQPFILVRRLTINSSYLIALSGFYQLTMDEKRNSLCHMYKRLWILWVL
jgi:hypothetical protein